MRPTTPLLALALVGCAAGPVGQRNPATDSCAPAAGWPETPGLDARIDALRREARLPGLAACALVDGELAWCGGFGTLEGGGGGPVTADTPFLLASVSKLLTATAVLQLAEEGRLDLDADLQEVLPFRLRHPRAPDEPITARMVLSHTAGIADNDVLMDGWYRVGADPDRPLSDLVAGYFDPRGADYDADANFLGQGPARRYAYSNMGYALLGAVVEAVTGEDFADRTRRTLLVPLGMADSAWRLSELDLDRVALPTSWWGGRWVSHGHYTFADYPNGGLRSSACDMGRFLGVMAQGGAPVLRAPTLAAAMAPAYPDLDARQGLGWYREDVGDTRLWVGHSGGEDGVETEAFLRRDGRLGVVLLANGDGDRAAPIYEIEDAVRAWAERQLP